MINELVISLLFVCGIIGDLMVMVFNKFLIGLFKNCYDLVIVLVMIWVMLSEVVSQIV